MRNLVFFIVLLAPMLGKSQNVIIGRNAAPLNGELVTDNFSLFNKDKATFIGGELSSSSNWSPDSLGLYSFGWGKNVKSKGEGSLAFGDQSEALGQNSVSMGIQSIAQGPVSFAFGDQAYASGAYAFAIGYRAQAIGNETFALGNVEAKGQASFATGISNETNGQAAFVVGQNNFANGDISFAAGSTSYAQGNNSTAIGSGVSALSFNEFVIGLNNTSYIPNSATGWVSDDRLFVIGNGASSPSDAVVVLKNGNIAFPDGNMVVGAHFLPQNGESISKSIMMFDKTKSAFRGGELLNSMNWSPNSLGLYSFGWGKNVKSKGEGSLAFGDQSEALGQNSVSMGIQSIAQGPVSFAFGDQAYASGTYAFAVGYRAQAIGNESFALGNVEAKGQASFATGISNETNGQAAFVVGQNNFANGDISFAAGSTSYAQGNNSTAIGSGVSALSFNEFVIGLNNTSYIPNSATGWVSDDRLFVIGNGASSPSDAMVVLKNGNTTINGSTTVNGEIVLNGDSRITDSSNPELLFERIGSTLYDAKIRVGSTGNMYFEGGSDISSGLAINMTLRSSGRLGVGTTNPSEKLSVVGNIVATGNITSNSDRRFKAKIKPIASALSKVNQLNGYYYYWNNVSFPEKKFATDRQIGVIAQEVEVLFPEMVLTDEDGYKSVDYSRMTPVLIEAVKDLSNKNDDLQQQIDALKTQVDLLLKLQAEN